MFFRKAKKIEELERFVQYYKKSYEHSEELLRLSDTVRRFYMEHYKDENPKKREWRHTKFYLGDVVETVVGNEYFPFLFKPGTIGIVKNVIESSTDPYGNVYIIECDGLTNPYYECMLELVKLGNERGKE